MKKLMLTGVMTGLLGVTVWAVAEPAHDHGDTAAVQAPADHAAMMAMRITGRNRILVARSVHPEYREVLTTYTRHLGVIVDEVAYDQEQGSIDWSDLESKIKIGRAHV